MIIVQWEAGVRSPGERAICRWVNTEAKERRRCHRRREIGAKLCWRTAGGGEGRWWGARGGGLGEDLQETCRRASSLGIRGLCVPGGERLTTEMKVSSSKFVLWHGIAAPQHRLRGITRTKNPKLDALGKGMTIWLFDELERRIEHKKITFV